jgi:hypothetical protein
MGSAPAAFLVSKLEETLERRVFVDQQPSQQRQPVVVDFEIVVSVSDTEFVPKHVADQTRTTPLFASVSVLLSQFAE